MKRFVALPKNQITLFLLLLLAVAGSKFGYLQALLLFVMCFGFTAGSDILFTYMRRHVVFFPRSAIITGLILTLIIDPSALWYQIAVIALGAMAIKNFIRPYGRHIFNPAASGLAIGWIVFRLQPSWWAPSPYDTSSLLTFSNLVIFIPILLIGYVSFFKFRRYVSALTYGVVYLILLYLTNISTSPGAALGTVLSIGTLFYMFLMLVEPMTSPIKKKRQALYGVFVAGCTLGLIFTQKMTGIALFDVSLTALLLGNLFFFRFK